MSMPITRTSGTQTVWIGFSDETYPRKELVKAEAPSLQLMQCTEHIRKARKALKKGTK
ncbi:MAG: hypothetical protein WCJ30_07105 [Deltaproteobacteria bacterium]